ncbi:Fc.00g011350.m01.CDS01 [Cosmosporella sp. VM-42]
MCDFSCYGGISDEWLAIEAGLPPPADADMDLSELKRITNNEREEISAKGMKQLAPQVHMQDHSIPTRDGSSIEARSYRPVSIPLDTILPVYIHLQGGGFMFGTLASEDAICARIASGSLVAVLNVNYRHTPEYTYPTQWNDAEDAFEWAHDNMSKLQGNADKLIMGGISAGAWVAASLVLDKHLRKDFSRPVIAGQVLMIPCLTCVHCFETSQLKKMRHHSVSSYRENEKAPLLSVSELKYFTDMLKLENPDVSDLKLNPGNATHDEVKGLPPTVLGIVGLDPLRDDGLLYAKMLTEAGVPTDVNLFLGMPHGFRCYEDKLTASERWDRVMEEGVCWILAEPVPSNEFHVKT